MPEEHPPVAIYFAGTAGAGKTSLTRAFAEWMEEADYSVATVNLDPGNEDPAFDPDVDIREWVKLADVMRENKLGPNGAQVAAADLAAMRVDELKEAVDAQGVDYLLVDTPGQVELFAFRESSRSIVESLSGPRSLIAFLFDPLLARHPSGFVSLALLSSTVQFRFRLPMLTVLAKSDLLAEAERTQVLQWAENPETLYLSLDTNNMEREGEGVLSREFFRALETVSPAWPLFGTSAQDQSGLEDLYAAIQETFAGGEDVEKPGSDAPPTE